MRKLKLMADYQCYPLWNLSPGDYENLSPESLPISTALRDALNAWADQYDLTLDLSDPSTAGFDSRESANRFVATGHALLARLREELGPGYDVSYLFKANPKPSSV
jgi:hypothetical protein